MKDDGLLKPHGLGVNCKSKLTEQLKGLSKY